MSSVGSAPSYPSSVLLTGAAGGIGSEVARHLSGLGVQVLGADVTDLGDRTDIDVLRHGRYLRCDLTAPADRAALLEEMRRRDVTAAVSLAGIVVSGAMSDQSDDDVRRVMEVNVVAQAALARDVAEQWREDAVAGHFLTVGSWVHSVGWPGIGPYAASKAALQSITRTFAREYARDGIRFNMVSPGIVGIGMALKQWETEPDYRARARRAIPLGSLQTPLSVAQAIGFLLSDWAGYMTGSTLQIDGGASLYPLDPEEIATD